MIRCLLVFWAALLSTDCLFGVEYYRRAVKKVSSEREYSQEQLDRWQFATRVEEVGGTAFLSRCSYTMSEGEVTCDRYKADRIVYDSNVKIKKYYHFRSQFNFQIFPDLNSIEDNGRGDIQFGKCELVAP
jgi:hypothetical protein